MHTARPVAAALLVAAAALFVQAIELPIPVQACSCVAPLPTLADVADEEGATIELATVGQQMPDRTPALVNAWFRGAQPADVVWLSGGSNMMSSCDVGVSAGQQWLFVLSGGDAGVYSAISCSPQGMIGTPEGDALLADALAIFGSPQAPPTPEPEQPSPIDLAPWLGGLGWVAAAAIVGVLLFGAIALVARRRPSG
jgi:hypothetical protein